MAKGDQNKLAKRASGFPAVLSVTAGVSDGANPSRVNVSGIEFSDLLVAVIEDDEGVGGVRKLNDNVANSTVVNGGGTVSMGGTVPANRPILTFWYDFD